MSAHDPEEPADRARPVSHDQVDHEPERADRNDSDPGDQDDLRVLVRRRLAGHLEDSPESAFPEPLHPLLDPPLDLPAPVHDVRHGPHRTMSSRSLSPSPIIATPPPFMIVLMSLKSRFTRPGFVMTSVIPLIARIRTSSATLNAAFKARRGTSSRSLSFGITTTVSAKLRSFSKPNSAFSARIAPSARNGKVHIAIVRAPASFASCATTGAPPVPVPPPRPHVMKIMSAPCTTERISSAASRADSSPTCGKAPAPNPRVTP